MKKIATYVPAVATSIALMAPMLASAQVAVRNVFQLGDFIIGIINDVLVPVVLAIAFIVFIWGIFTYFIQGGSNDEKREQGQKLMLYGIIGFFLMVSVWGLVNILVGTFNFNQNIPNIPKTPGIGG